jgi:hypothetical protein
MIASTGSAAPIAQTTGWASPISPEADAGAIEEHSRQHGTSGEALAGSFPPRPPTDCRQETSLLGSELPDRPRCYGVSGTVLERRLGLVRVLSRYLCLRPEHTKLVALWVAQDHPPGPWSVDTAVVRHEAGAPSP